MIFDGFDFDKINQWCKTNGKVVLIAGLSLIFLMGITTLIVFFVAIRGEEQVLVPDVVGKDISVAILELQAKELNTRVQLRYSNSADEKNVVLEQKPGPGAIVKAGKKIELVISRGVIINRVEDYVGQTIDDVKMHLQTLFTSTTRPLVSVKEPPLYKYDSSPVGTILEQEPPAGTDIVNPVELVFVVSQGPENAKVTVPDVTGLTVENLLLQMQKSKLIFTFSTREPQSGEKQGSVVSQTPAAGAVVNAYSTLECTLAFPSKGDGKKVYGLITQELPKYAYPLDVRLEAIYPSGLTEEIVSLKHPGGTLTIPYYQESGTVLVLNILNKEVGRFEVTK